MESRATKIYAPKNKKISLKVILGHFATSHSHINLYIDLTTAKTRLSEASETAKALVASATTGDTVRRSLDCISYYGGVVRGISAIFSAVSNIEDLPVYSIFKPGDLPD